MKEYKHKLLKIFVPIMLSNLISQIQMFIDRIFLGRMNILYMSAVGNASCDYKFSTIPEDKVLIYNTRIKIM